MSARESLIDELEGAIERGSMDRRAEVLRRITDLFLSAGRSNEEQIALYDDIIARLIAHIGARALGELSERLASVDHAPPNAIQLLALSNEISVAGPVLTQSNRVSDPTLVTVARTKSQAHLLAISGRKRLNEPVTDVLVDRGNADVARGVAANPGACLSGAGFDTLAKRAETDGELLESIMRRSDVPLQVFCGLLARATDVVRQRLLAATRPEVHSEVRRVVSRISGEVAAESPVAPDYASALRTVLLTCSGGNVSEGDILNFAQSNRFEETVSALSVLCSVPIDVVDQIMCGDRIETLLILCKAADFKWSTVRAIIQLRPGGRMRPEQLVEACDDFAKLANGTAQRVLTFWQNRQEGSAS